MGTRASELDLGAVEKVAWSDESRFLLDHVDGHVRVRRLPGEVMAPGCTVGI